MVKHSWKKTAPFILICLVLLLGWRENVRGATTEELEKQLSDLRDKTIQAQIKLVRIRGIRAIPAGFVFAKNLKLNDYDLEIVYLQTILKSEGFYCRTCLVTGYYGLGTRRAVLNFQQKKRLSSTGLADSPTRQKFSQIISSQAARYTVNAAKPLCRSSLPSSPALLSPADNAVEQSLSLTLSWDNPLSWGYRCSASGQPTPPEKQRYRLEVSDSADFNQPVVDVALPVSQNSFKIDPGVLLAGTIYHWRVRVEGDLESDYNLQSFGVSFSPSVDLKVNGSNGPITVNYNNSVKLSWNVDQALNCLASGSWQGQKKPKGSEKIDNLKKDEIFTLTCTGKGGEGSDEVEVKVLPQPVLNLESRISFNNEDWREELSGLLPLEGVDFKLDVSGNTSGSIVYKVDCTADGSWDKELKSAETLMVMENACDYPALGSYRARLRAERSGLSAEKTLNVVAFETSLPDLDVTRIDRSLNGGKATYTAHIVNRGPAFEQSTVYYWFVNYVSQVRGILPGLNTGEEETIFYQTPSAGLIQFQADADSQLEEASKKNNLLFIDSRQ